MDKGRADARTDKRNERQKKKQKLLYIAFKRLVTGQEKPLKAVHSVKERAEKRVEKFSVLHNGNIRQSIREWYPGCRDLWKSPA